MSQTPSRSPRRRQADPNRPERRRSRASDSRHESDGPTPSSAGRNGADGPADPLHLPGSEEALTRQVLDALTSAGRAGATAGELEGKVAREASGADVAAALARLAQRGRAVERSRRWYAVAATGYVAGRVDGLEGGDAMIRPIPATDPPPGVPVRRSAPEYFVEANHLRGALAGDLVLVKKVGGKARDVAGRRLTPASVVSVAERRSQTLVGTLETDPDGRRWLAPFDAGTAIDLEVVESQLPDQHHRDIPDGHYVVVEVIRGSGSRGDSHPRATVAEHLGAVDSPGVDVLAVLRHYRIPDEFPPEVVEYGESLPADPTPADWEGRTDLRDVVTVTIDGESARDFDDAITCERLGRDRWRVGVHIADVAHYVQEGGALDREAYRRGTSVYYPDRAIPMLPERISNGLCSLRPDVPRLAMSAFLDVDRDGVVQRSHFTQSVIRSDRRLTYDEVRRVLEEERPRDAIEYGEVLPLLRECREVMEVLNAARRQRGSIDFDLPAGDVVLDTDGFTVGVTPGERHVAHRIVEEMMIAANEAVAHTLDDHGSPALYRVHDAPGEDDLEGLAQILASLGIRLPKDLERLHPRHLQAVLEEAEGSPQEPFVSTLVLRTMQRALYSPECRGHYALASRYYTHFTSPIRRYPDLVVHRRLKAFIEHRDEVGEGPFSLPARLPGIAAHASSTERRAEASERDLLQWKKVRFLAERVGETFQGRITGVQPFGLFVQLEDYYVDGLVPIRTLGDDYYLYEADRHRLVGDHQGRVFRLADEVEVKLVGVSPAHRGLDLVIADLSEPQRRSRGRRRGGRR